MWLYTMFESVKTKEYLIFYMVLEGYNFLEIPSDPGLDYMTMIRCILVY